MFQRFILAGTLLAAPAFAEPLSTEQRVLANAAYLMGANVNRAYTALVSASNTEARLKDASFARDSWTLSVRRIDDCIFGAVVKEPTGDEFSVVVDFNRISDRYDVRRESIDFLGHSSNPPICGNWPRHKRWCAYAVTVFSPRETAERLVRSMNFVKENGCPGYVAGQSTPRF